MTAEIDGLYRMRNNNDNDDNGYQIRIPKTCCKSHY